MYLTNGECLTWLQRVSQAGIRVALLVWCHHRHCVVLPALDVCHPAALAVRPAAGWLAVFLRHRGRVELGPCRAAPRHHGDVGQAVHETADVGGRARLWEKRRRRNVNNLGRTQSGGKKLFMSKTIYSYCWYFCIQKILLDKIHLILRCSCASSPMWGK